MSEQRLIFAIHELNTWAGQERCTLEIAKRLSHRLPVELCCFALNDSSNQPWGEGTKTSLIRPFVRRPAIARDFVYYLLSLFKLRGRRRDTIVSAGACTWVTDVVVVHYIHASWKAFCEREENRSTNSGPRSLKQKLNALYQRFYTWQNLWHERHVFTNARKFIAISNSVADDLKRHYGIDDENIEVIHHGVDAGVFTPCRDTDERATLRRDLSLNPDDFILLLVGSLERKGLDIAIQGVAELAPEERGNLKLVGVGSGDHTRFERQASELGVSSNLQLVPFTKEVQKYFRAADMFVLPTRYDPFGLVILEAMAAGLPCIVSSVAGASDLITDGEDGLLVADVLNSGEWAQQIRRVLGDRDLKERMAIKARETAEHHSWDHVAEKYETFLKSCM